MRDIKFQYIVIGFCGNVMKETFPLHDIQNGYAETWLQVNTIKGDLYRRQFTGLQDKNGVDIYEGDIVSCRGIINTIFFHSDEGAFCAENKNNICSAEVTSRGAVIGNIHQTPELLEK